ncbi:MAG: glycosyltransferase [Chitinophagaceae bacterium]|nr:glycosyltransferase [Chitinophagaceae bacterium]
MSQLNGYALWICSWYPNELDPLTGDFLQRHAQAVSLYMPVQVWAFIHDDKGRITTTSHQVTRQAGQLTETVVYFHVAATGIKLLDSWRRWRAQYKLARQLVATLDNKPVLMHAQIAVYAAFIVRRLAHRWQVPYFISEQWTEYLAEARPNFAHANAWVRWQWKLAMQGAAGVSAGSQYLARRLQQLAGRPVVRIPNVVNTAVFNSSEVTDSLPQLIHVSTFSAQKQPEHILQAFAQVVARQPKARLVMVGPHRPHLQALAAALGCQQQISWLHEMPQPELVKEIARSKALLLFSAFETFGCVVIEALAVGVPVIASDIPPMRELLTRPAQGWLVPQGQVPALAEAMERALLQRDSPAERMPLSTETCAEFSYQNVGAAFIRFYQQAPTSFE